MKELAKCPWCGGEAEINRVDRDDLPSQYYGICTHCAAATGNLDTPEQAEYAWHIVTELLKPYMSPFGLELEKEEEEGNP